mgnify:CR=1 FL=1
MVVHTNTIHYGISRWYTFRGFATSEIVVYLSDTKQEHFIHCDIARIGEIERILVCADGCVNNLLLLFGVKCNI